MKYSPEILDLSFRLAQSVDLPGPRGHAPVKLNWDRWLGLAETHRVAPYVLRHAPAALPDEVTAELTKLRAREGRDAFLRAAQFRAILDTLGTRVEFVALKGAALLASLYESGVERAMCDVDLLLRSDADLRTAQALLVEHGFSPGKKLTSHHHAPALKDEFHVLGVELHTNLVTPPLPDGLIGALWDRRVMSPHGYRVLDPVGQLIHHAIHTLNDPVESPLLRNFFETAWLVQQLAPPLREDVQRIARRWNVDEMVSRTLWLAHELFGSPILFDRPRESFHEFWCRHALKWPADLPFALRVVRHTAHDHLRMIHRGAHPLSPLPIAIIVSTWLFQGAMKVIRHVRGPFQPAAGHAVKIDDCIIFGAERTGEVHLLNADAARAFEGGNVDRKIQRELARRGVLISSAGAWPPTEPAAPRPS